MPRRALIFAKNEIYHIYNRSVGHEVVFESTKSLHKILEITAFYQYPQKLRLSRVKLLPPKLKDEYITAYLMQQPYVEFLAFAFMPNHYHFLVRQLRDNGIKLFASNLQNSFAKYFNTKYDRHGTLFQKPFSARRIETDEDCLHVSRYIHLNPVTAYLIEFSGLATYPYTSLLDYCSESRGVVDKEFLIGLIGPQEKYQQFVADQVDYQRTLGVLKHLLLDIKV